MKIFLTVTYARSKLPTLIKPVTGIKFGRNTLVKKFVKGFLHFRTSNFIWNINDLFKHYRAKEINEELELKSITVTRVTLLALLLCQRTQTLYSLVLRFLKIETDIIHIAILEILKQFRHRKHLRPVKLNS